MPGCNDHHLFLALMSVDDLLQVQEAASACVDWLHLPDVAINLANLYLAQRQIAAAIQLYTTTLQKHYKNNSTIMLYLARALYDAGKNSQAKRVLLKAIHLQPTQNLLRFNSAVTMQVGFWVMNPGVMWRNVLPFSATSPLPLLAVCIS